MESHNFNSPVAYVYHFSDCRIPFKIGQPKKQIVSKTVSHIIENVLLTKQNVAFAI